MVLKAQKRMLSFLLALVLVLSTFLSVAVLPASAAGEANYGVLLPYDEELTTTFGTLQEAIDYVDESEDEGWIITVLQDVNYSDECTIPANTTLLIPYDDNNTVYTNEDTADMIIGSNYATPAPYRTFTMTANSSLTVEEGGSICVCSQLYSNGQIGSANGSPTGKHGRICMEGGSEIIIGDGANLYAWGYIYASPANGEGGVTIEGGGSVYEPFQILNFRGGSETANCVSNGVFPFNQYYVQNVEVPMTLEYGAKETAVAALTAGSTIYPVPVSFIGEDGMFVITDPSGYLIKDYLEASDRLDVRIYGDAKLSPLTLKGLPVLDELSSESFNLPITNNISVDVKEGNTEINQSVILLPGTEMVVDGDAGVSITEEASVYVYDASDWDGSYVGNNSKSDFISLPYTTAHGTETSDVRENANPDGLPSAKVDINGGVVVRGGFYASGNADISSSENTGTITYATNAETSATLAECSNNKNITPIEYGVAQLRKPGAEVGSTNPEDYVSPLYTDPETGNTYYAQVEIVYDENEDEGMTYSLVYVVTWVDYNDNILYSAPYKTGDIPEYNGRPIVTSNAQYTFGPCIGWATTPHAGEPEVRINNAFPEVGTADVTYYAVHTVTEKTYTVQWLDDSSEVLKTETNVKYSDINSADYDGDEPTVADIYENFNSGAIAYKFRANNEYKAKKTVKTFTGWNAPTYNDGVCTFTPDFDDTVYYNLLYLNDDQDTVLYHVFIPTTSVAQFCPAGEYQGVEPTKDSDANYTYDFSGWKSLSNQTYPLSNENSLGNTSRYDPSGNKSNSNRYILVPTFTQTERTEYTITWLDENGDQITTTTVEINEIPTPPAYEVEGDERYEYAVSWPTLAPATEDTIYQATVTPVERYYTVSWIHNDETVYPDAYLSYSEIQEVLDSEAYPAPETEYQDVTRYKFADTANVPEVCRSYDGKLLQQSISYSWDIGDYNLDDGTCTIVSTGIEGGCRALALWLSADQKKVEKAEYYTIGNGNGVIKPAAYAPAVTPYSDMTNIYTPTGNWIDCSDEQTMYGPEGSESYSIQSQAKNINWSKNVFIPVCSEAKIKRSHSLSLDGSVGVNFYPNFSEDYNASNTTASFTWGAKFITTQQYDTLTPKTMTGVKGTGSGDKFKFTLPIAMKELNDLITVEYKCGNETATEQFRPTAYLYELYEKTQNKTDEQLRAEGILTGNQTGEKLRELIRTLLISAADAQISFNYNTTGTDCLATYDFGRLGISDVLGDVSIPQEKILYPASKAFEDVTFYGSALNLEDELGYTLYFDIDDPQTYSVRKIGDVSATIKDINGNTKRLKLHDELGVLCLGGNKRLRIKLDGIAAAELTNDIELTYKGTTITVNPAEYIDLALEQGSASLQNTVTALYFYNQAAIAFFGGNNNNG